MKIYADTALLKLQFLSLFGIMTATVLGQNSVASAMFTMTFFLTVGLWVTISGKRISSCSVLMMLIVLLSCACVLINAALTDTRLSFSYLKKMIMFWSTLIFFVTMSEYRPNRQMVTFFFRGNTCVALLFVAMYFLQRENMYLYSGRISNYLIFGFTNPNLTAVFLSAICIVELLSAYVSKKWTGRLLHLALAGMMIFFVVLSQARNAMLLLLLFLVAFLLTVLFPRLRISGGMAALIAVFPLLFASAYMLVINSEWVQRLFAFIVSDGKELDSRVDIWTGAFRNIAASPLIGAYSQISGGDGSAQLHNSHLDVAASYGCLILILLCVLLYQILFNKYEKPKRGMAFVCTAGFSALLLSGIGEAMIYAGGLGIYLFAGAIRMLANYDWETGG